MSQSNDDDDDDATVIRTAGVPPTPSASHHDDDSHSLPIGLRLGEFEILERIGEGGFSVVYLVRDHSLDRDVALKEYMPSTIARRTGQTRIDARSIRHKGAYDAGLRSFINEAKLLASFDNPSLVKVYRFWEANGTAYMVMPFYQGVTLRDAVRAMPAPPDEAWLRGLLAPLTQALAAIHAAQCYHRDIAPDNIILLAGSGKPLLLDFGAARRVIGDMTQGLTVILKPGYAPVEQYADMPGMKQGAWTDVYALAALVYWIISGRTPPVSVGRVVHDSYVPLSESAKGRYSTSFLQAVDRGLGIRPEHRTQSIEAFRREIGLDDITADTERTVVPEPKSQPKAKTRTKTEARSQAKSQVPQPQPEPRPLAQPQRDRQPKPVQWAAIVVGAFIIAASGAAAWWFMGSRSADTSTSATSSPTPAPADPAASSASSSTSSSDTTSQGTELPNVLSVPSPSSTPATSEAEIPASPYPPAIEPQPPIGFPSPRLEPPPQAPPSALPTDPVARPLPGRSDSRQPPSAPAPPRRSSAKPDGASPGNQSGNQPSHQSSNQNGAECARILQQLSMGLDAAALLSRQRELGCK
jgi:serine/threonine protein kinase